MPTTPSRAETYLRVAVVFFATIAILFGIFEVLSPDFHGFLSLPYSTPPDGR